MDATQIIANCSFAACAAKREHAQVELFLDVKGNLSDCRVVTPCKPSLAVGIAVARAEEAIEDIMPKADVSRFRELVLCVEFSLHHLQAFCHLAESLQLPITEFRPRLGRLTQSVEAILPTTDDTRSSLALPDAVVHEQIGQLGGEALELAQQCRRLFDDSIVRFLQEDDSLPHDILGHRPLSVCLTDEYNRLQFSGNHLRIVGSRREELTRFLPFEFEHGFTDLTSGGYVSSTLARTLAAESMSTPAAAAAHDGLLNSIRSRTANLSVVNQWGRLVELLYATEYWTGFVAPGEKARVDSPAEIGDPPAGSHSDGESKQSVSRDRPIGVGWAESPYGLVIDVCECVSTGKYDHQTTCGPFHNAAAIAGEIRKATESMIHKSQVDGGLPSVVEAMVRRHDVGLPSDASYRRGQLPLEVTIYRSDESVLRRQTQNLY